MKSLAEDPLAHSWISSDPRPRDRGRPRRWCRATIRPCCSPMRAWCSSRTSSPGRKSGPTAAPPRRRNACAPAASTMISTMSAIPRATTPSSRCWGISPSAIISRKTPSSSPGTCHQGIRPAQGPAVGHRLSDDDEARQPVEEDRRPSRQPHHPHSDLGQFLGDGRHRPLRPVLGNLLSTMATSSGRPAGQRRRRWRPLHRILEPGLHAVRAGEQAGAHRPAQALHRYRHGAGAHRRRPAGRPRQLRYRPVPPPDRGLGREDRGPGRRANSRRRTASSPIICARPPS